jgi:molybdenum cofactor cytidylyltransferase
MLSSVRCGLLALPANTETVLLVPGDQARLGSALVRESIAAYRASERSIAVPIHAGRRGHPLLFSSGYRDEILSRFDGVGLRGLLLAHPDEVLQWPTSDAAVLEDLDRPDDYRRVLQGAAGKGWDEGERER